MGPERIIALLTLASLLTACGVDGPPQPPPPKPPPPSTSITIEGQAEAGVTGRS